MNTPYHSSLFAGPENSARVRGWGEGGGCGGPDNVIFAINVIHRGQYGPWAQLLLEGGPYQKVQGNL